jgi:hypothetical protein
VCKRGEELKNEPCKADGTLYDSVTGTEHDQDFGAVKVAALAGGDPIAAALHAKGARFGRQFVVFRCVVLHFFCLLYSFVCSSILCLQALPRASDAHRALRVRLARSLRGGCCAASLSRALLGARAA